MNPKMKLILKILSDVLVGVTILFAFLLYGIRLFGLTPYTVLSGSMESVYPTGSLIYVKDIDPAELEVGDTVTFRLASDTVATHRIIEFVPDEADPDTIRFRTKGDENEVADGSLVSYSNVIGKPVFCIPYLGYFATYIMQPPGKYVAITVAIALILIELMISIVLDDKDKKKTQTE